MELVGWVLDMDGVLWLAEQPIKGSARAVEILREKGEQIAFVTNNSYARRGDVAAKLGRHGIDARDDVITSAMAVASLVEPGERILVCAGPGVVEELTNRGCEIVAMPTDDPGQPVEVDAVVVGYHPEFDYGRMWASTRAVLDGARLLATNSDSTYPTPQGLAPGGGAILAAIETATGVRAEVAGKPHSPIADLVRDRLGNYGIVVGDRPETDGAFARVLGFRFGLVLTGVTSENELPQDSPPEVVARDLFDLVMKVMTVKRV